MLRLLLPLSLLLLLLGCCWVVCCEKNDNNNNNNNDDDDNDNGGDDGVLAWEDVAPSLHNQLARRAMAGAHWAEQDICKHSLKMHDACNNSTLVPMLITGTGRSGTHHISNVLKLKGFDVCHEHICADGSVSWAYAVYDSENKYVWESRIKRTNQRFRHVFHMVRHPLHAIASLTTYTDTSWEFIGRHTPEVPGLATIQPILRRALIHWVTWNRMVSVFADERFRAEDNPPAVICIAAGFDREKCAQHATDHAPRAPREHEATTWAQLLAVDREFAEAAMELARSYGYEALPGIHGGPAYKPNPST